MLSQLVWFNGDALEAAVLAGHILSLQVTGRMGQACPSQQAAADMLEVVSVVMPGWRRRLGQLRRSGSAWALAQGPSKRPRAGQQGQGSGAAWPGRLVSNWEEAVSEWESAATDGFSDGRPYGLGPHISMADASEELDLGAWPTAKRLCMEPAALQAQQAAQQAPLPTWEWQVPRVEALIAMLVDQLAAEPGDADAGADACTADGQQQGGSRGSGGVDGVAASDVPASTSQQHQQQQQQQQFVSGDASYARQFYPLTRPILVTFVAAREQVPEGQSGPGEADQDVGAGEGDGQGSHVQPMDEDAIPVLKGGAGGSGPAPAVAVALGGARGDAADLEGDGECIVTASRHDHEPASTSGAHPQQQHAAAGAADAQGQADGRDGEQRRCEGSVAAGTAELQEGEQPHQPQEEPTAAASAVTGRRDLRKSGRERAAAGAAAGAAGSAKESAPGTAAGAAAATAAAMAVQEVVFDRLQRCFRPLPADRTFPSAAPAQEPEAMDADHAGNASVSDVSVLNPEALALGPAVGDEVPGLADDTVPDPGVQGLDLGLGQELRGSSALDLAARLTSALLQRPHVLRALGGPARLQLLRLATPAVLSLSPVLQQPAQAMVLLEMHVAAAAQLLPPLSSVRPAATATAYTAKSGAQHRASEPVAGPSGRSKRGHEARAQGEPQSEHRCEFQGASAQEEAAQHLAIATRLLAEVQAALLLEHGASDHLPGAGIQRLGTQEQGHVQGQGQAELHVQAAAAALLAQPQAAWPPATPSMGLGNGTACQGDASAQPQAGVSAGQVASGEAAAGDEAMESRSAGLGPEVLEVHVRWHWLRGLVMEVQQRVSKPLVG